MHVHHPNMQLWPLPTLAPLHTHLKAPAAQPLGLRTPSRSSPGGCTNCRGWRAAGAGPPQSQPPPPRLQREGRARREWRGGGEAAGGLQPRWGNHRSHRCEYPPFTQV